METMWRRRPYPVRATRRALRRSRRRSTLDSLSVEGTIPEWLTGTLLRNGPAKFEAGEQAASPLVRRPRDAPQVLLRRRRVSYANRFLRSEAYRAAEREGRISYREFATDPCRSIFKRAATMFRPKITDNCNVNLDPARRRVHRDDRDAAAGRLRPRDARDARRRLRAARDPCHRSSSSRPRARRAGRLRDPLRSRAASTGSSPSATGPPSGGSPRYALRNPPTCTASRSPSATRSSSPSRSSSTRSASLSPGGRSSRTTAGSRSSALGCSSSIARTANCSGAYEAEPRFSFHHVNAFEREGELVLDMAAYDDATIVDSLLSRSPAGDAAAAEPHSPGCCATAIALDGGRWPRKSSATRCSSCRGSTTASATASPTATSTGVGAPRYRGGRRLPRPAWSRSTSRAGRRRVARARRLSRRAGLRPRPRSRRGGGRRGAALGRPRWSLLQLLPARPRCRRHRRS